MASRLPAIGTSFAEANRQLKEQNDKLKIEVARLEAEIAGNREVIAAQARRILELELQLANRTLAGVDLASGEIAAEEHRTYDPAPAYVVDVTMLAGAESLDQLVERLR